GFVLLWFQLFSRTMIFNSFFNIAFYQLGVYLFFALKSPLSLRLCLVLLRVYQLLMLVLQQSSLNKPDPDIRFKSSKTKQILPVNCVYWNPPLKRFPKRRKRQRYFSQEE